LEINILDVDMA